MKKEEYEISDVLVRPGPLHRAAAVALGAIGLGAGGLLLCFGISLLLQRFILEGPKAEVKSSLDQPIEMARNGAPKESIVIKRKVTVFSTVTHGDGEITTGWEFEDGHARVPVRQYCYYLVPIAGENYKSNKVDIAYNGARLPNIDESSVPDLLAAIEKCQWWKPTGS
jgi:hypothetical protein